MLDVRCPQHLEDVRRFAAACGLADQLQAQLDRLADFGNAGLPPGDPRRVENRCVLTRDFAPHSFGFAIRRPDPAQPDGWRDWLVGGLIFQSPAVPAHGGAPSFTVSLAEGTGWFIHT